MMQRTVPIAGCLLWVALIIRPAAALVSTNVPLDHWSYEAVEKLANYGLIDSSMLAVRPVSRVEMARHIGQAVYGLDRMASPPPILRSILERLKEEFREELILIDILDGPYSDSSVKPVEDPYIRYLYARNEPDLENRRGDVFRQDSNYRAGFASRGRLFDWAAFYLHPEYADSSQNDGDVDVIEGYGKVMAGPFEIEGGKDSLWWGPGRHGSIILSNNAQPFTMVKLTNPQPVRLPWILRGLGPFKGQWFLTSLEEDRAIPEPKLTGLRFDIKPFPWLELGASRVMMFGGHGVPRVSCLDYAEMMLTISREREENNQLAGVDGALLIPLGDNVPLRSVRLYSEWTGEDEAGWLPSKWSYVLGLQLNDIFRTGRTDLRVEYTDAHPFLYQHHIYTSGYTYEGRVMGHHVGPDAQDIFIQLSHYLRADVLVDLSYDRESHYSPGDTDWVENILECNLTLFPSPNWRIRTGYRYENRDNAGNDDNHVLQLELVRRF